LSCYDPSQRPRETTNTELVPAGAPIRRTHNAHAQLVSRSATTTRNAISIRLGDARGVPPGRLVGGGKRIRTAGPSRKTRRSLWPNEIAWLRARDIGRRAEQARESSSHMTRCRRNVDSNPRSLASHRVRQRIRPHRWRTVKRLGVLCRGRILTVIGDVDVTGIDRHELVDHLLSSPGRDSRWHCPETRAKRAPIPGAARIDTIFQPQGPEEVCSQKRSSWGDRGFESCSLQRRVCCEPDFRARIPSTVGYMWPDFR